MKFLIGIAALTLGLGFILIPSLTMLFGSEFQGDLVAKLIGGAFLAVAGAGVLWLELAVHPASRSQYLQKTWTAFRRHFTRYK
jgi:hypothetical protein